MISNGAQFSLNPHKGPFISYIKRGFIKSNFYLISTITKRIAYALSFLSLHYQNFTISTWFWPTSVWGYQFLKGFGKFFCSSSIHPNVGIEFSLVMSAVFRIVMLTNLKPLALWNFQRLKWMPPGKLRMSCGQFEPKLSKIGQL